MTTAAEDALYAALTEIDDLEYLAKVGLPMETIPTKAMREVVEWALKYYFDSGRRQAPSREKLLENWQQKIDDAEVELVPEDAERDTIESAVETLKGRYADSEWQAYIKEAATEMATSAITQKVDTLTRVTNLLFETTHNLQDRTEMVEVNVGLADSLKHYKERAGAESTVQGMATGFHQIDEHTGGIRDGELAILAAGPKVGKSLAAAAIALNEFRRGRCTVLFTLENSVEMTFDRLVLLAAGAVKPEDAAAPGWVNVSAREYQRGLLSKEALERVERVIEEELADMKEMLHVISPPQGARTPEMLVRQAMMLGADSILVDQLTHVEHPDPGRKPRHELFNENIHQFKTLVSTGRERVPIAVMHQINREGVKAADKVGHLEMYHLAETQGAERAADWVFGMYQGDADRRAAILGWQILAARRADLAAWKLAWRPDLGTRMVVGTWEIDS